MSLKQEIAEIRRMFENLEERLFPKEKHEIKDLEQYIRALNTRISALEDKEE